jgi:hypothetical protein
MTTQHNSPTERAAGNHPESLHPGLFPLTDPEAAHLVHLAQTILAARDLLTFYIPATGTLAVPPSCLPATGPPSAPSPPNHLGGAFFGLGNLARTVAAQPRQRWAQLVEQHVDELLANVLRTPDLPTDPASQLYLRLAATSSLPAEWTAHLPEFLPGLVAVPATSNNGTFTLHFDPSTFGLTWTEAHRIALANLNRFTDNVTHVDHDGVQLAVLSDTTWAASRALVLDTVLRDSLQLENPEYGVLVALPARHLLLIHVIRDLAVLPALGAMLHLTHDAYEAAPGPLTRSIYLVDQSGWHPATTSPPDHPLRHHLSPHLQTLAQTLESLE